MARGRLNPGPCPRRPRQLRAALSDAGLAAGGVALRFPGAPFSSGAFSHPDGAVRAAALRLAAGGCRWARELGGELVVWSAFDGYDYHLQVGRWPRALRG
jgi:hypothetical protein